MAPEIEGLVTANVQERRNFSVRPVNADEFEVVSRTNVHGVVNLRTRSCYCGMWQYMDILCQHAIVVAAKRRIRPSELCSKYYRADCFKEIYISNIYPVANPDDWNVPESIRSMKVGVPNFRHAPPASDA